MDQAVAQEPQVSVGAALVWMVVYLALTNVGLVILTHLVGPLKNGLAMFGVWLLQLILIMGLAGWVNEKMGGRGWLFIVVILLAVYGLVYGLMLGHIPTLFRLRETPVIPVRDAARPEYADCDVFHFADGSVDVAHIRRRTTVGRNGRVNCFLAPVLPPDWKSGDPVPAWVGGSEISNLRPGCWDEDWRGGCRIGLDPTYEEMAREESSRHASAPNAPVLTWSKDPAADLRRVGLWELGIFLAIDAFGLVSVFLGSGVKPD